MTASAPETPAVTSEFSRDEAFLTGVLHDVLRASDGERSVELLDEAVTLGRGVRSGDAVAADRLAALVAELDIEQVEVLVRALTRWFQLVNLAEDSERVRRMRRRERRNAPAPRQGSIRDVISRIADRGTSAASSSRCSTAPSCDWS